MTRPDLPSTAAAAYDLCQQTFGIGTYDDMVSEVPWWKARALEIGKVSGILKRRRTSPEQLGMAVWYAQEHGIPITYVRELIALVNVGIRAWNKAEAAERHERALAELGVVIEEAQAAGEQEFVGQLIRADRDGAVRLIEQWRANHP